VAPDSSPSWQQLLDLIAILDGGEYDDVAVAFGDVSVQLSRTGTIGGPPEHVVAATDAVSADRPPQPAPPAPVSAPGPTPAHESVATGAAITAPMLGVFYRRPAPGEPPFVEPGDAVQPDTTIGIIEIMKLMNPVSAGVAGVIAGFEADDGAHVQFGEVLARLEA
jgi:acetyl-CoA carboxylase biotin carboxyl carrier protein